MDTNPSFWANLLSQAPGMLGAISSAYGSQEPEMQNISRISQMMQPMMQKRFNNTQPNPLNARPLGGVVSTPQTPRSSLAAGNTGSTGNSFWDTYGKFAGMMNIPRMF